MKIYKLLFSTLLVVIIATGCSLSPKKALEKFETAIGEEDATALYELVEKPEEIYWTEKEAQDVIEFFTENNSEYEQLLSDLHQQKDALKAKESLKNTDGIFYFDEEQRLMLREYEVVIAETSFAEFEKLNVTMSDADTVTVENGSDKAVNLGRFGPGNYALKGSADYGYVVLEAEEKMTLLDNEFQKVIEIDLKGESVNIYSEMPDTSVYLNDQEINQAIGKDAIALQPIVMGVTLQGKKQYNWGELVTEKKEYEGEQEYELTPNVFINEQETAEIANIITDYYTKLFQALVKNDKSILKDVRATEEVINGFDLQFDILDSNEKGEKIKAQHAFLNPDIYVGYYQGDINETLVDFAQVKNEVDEDSNEDMLAVQAYIYSDFMFVYTAIAGAPTTKEAVYLDPLVHLLKKDGKWIIAKQDIDFTRNEDLEIFGEHLITTKVE